MSSVQGVALDLAHADDPVDLLSRTLKTAGGVLRAQTPAGTDIVYFSPNLERLAQFHAAERSGALENHNTPAVKELFAGTVFTLSGPAHRQARTELMKYFGPRGTWYEDIAGAVGSWAASATAAGQIDLLVQTRRLAAAAFTRVVIGVDPESEEGEEVAELVGEFVTGAVEAVGASPDPSLLRCATDAGERLLRRARAAGETGGRSFAAHCLRQSGRSDRLRDLLAVLIASVETTANLLAWSIARWTLSTATDRADIAAFARAVEGLDSPNTVITRRVVESLSFQGVTLRPGTLLSYSPAPDPNEGSSARGSQPEAGPGDDTMPRPQVESVTFGSGPRACPGRSMARHIVECTLRAVEEQPWPWTLVSGDLPRTVAWFPVRTFGPGVLIRTGQ